MQKNPSLENFWLKVGNLHTMTQEERLAHGVMVLIIIEDSILFVKRSITMPSHKDQVALIGGHRKGDELFPHETALREFHEETDLPPSSLKILSTLPMVRTSREMGIIPVLALLEMDKTELKRKLKSNGEWDSAFLVNFSYLLDDSNWILAKRIGADERQNLLFCPLSLSNIEFLAGTIQDNFMLWGASARAVEHVRNFILTQS